MNTPCPTIRERLLADPDRAFAEAHLGSCESCRAWWMRTRRRIEALEGLARLQAPEELASRLEAALGGALPAEAETRLERELRALPRPTAPAILDDLVLDALPGEDGPAVNAVRRLSRAAVPSVLDRLVGEELEDPARHRAERFVGDLGRVPVPAELDRDPLRPDRPSAPRFGGLRWIAPALALAAGLVLWVGFESSGARPSTPDYDFDVVRASSPDQLSPLARTFLTGLTGGSSLTPLDRSGFDRNGEGPR